MCRFEGYQVPLTDPSSRSKRGVEFVSGGASRDLDLLSGRRSSRQQLVGGFVAEDATAR